MLSLIELQGKKVEAKRKKYEKDEMDAYLELVYENYKQLANQNKQLEAEKNELSQKIKKLSDGVQYYRSIETTLQKALILAEKTSKETKDAALLKAEAIEKDAHKKADEIIRSAEGEYNKIKDKCVQLVQQFNQFKHQLIDAASAQLEMVERDEFAISSPDDYEKKLNYSLKKEEKRASAQTQEASAPVVQDAPARQEKPEAPEQPKMPEQPKAPEQPLPQDILTADTIDLGSTLESLHAPEPAVEEAKPVQAAAASEPEASVILGNSEPEEESQNLQEPDLSASLNIPSETPQAAKDTELTATLDADVSAASVSSGEPVTVKAADVVPATVVEPIPASPSASGGGLMDAEFVSSSKGNGQAPAPKASEPVPTLDSLLQDLNLNNKNNQKSDDPFEFLGSTVDDF